MVGQFDGVAFTVAIDNCMKGIARSGVENGGHDDGSSNDSVGRSPIVECLGARKDMMDGNGFFKAYFSIVIGGGGGDGNAVTLNKVERDSRSDNLGYIGAVILFDSSDAGIRDVQCEFGNAAP